MLVIYGLYWPVVITPGHMRIGCQSHPTERWKTFSAAQIAAMDTSAPQFWATNREWLLAQAVRCAEGWAADHPEPVAEAAS